jgi:hypothetical protein
MNETSKLCWTDLDCAGDRICVDGECRFPAEAPPQRAPAPAPQPQVIYQVPPQVIYQAPPRTLTEGWAREAAVTGFVTGGVTLVLAGASEATRENQIPSLPIGGVATLVFAVSTPIVASGGGSARDGADVEGSAGMRVTGWVLYGLGLANALSLIALGASEIEPPPGTILATGAIGAASQFLMAGDALRSHRQARARIDAQQAVGAAPTSGLAPLLAPISADGRAGGVLSVAGRF